LTNGESGIVVIATTTGKTRTENTAAAADATASAMQTMTTMMSRIGIGPRLSSTLVAMEDMNISIIGVTGLGSRSLPRGLE